nr:hypothetical protein [Haladaptatus sp. W1]
MASTPAASSVETSDCAPVVGSSAVGSVVAFGSFGSFESVVVDSVGSSVGSVAFASPRPRRGKRGDRAFAHESVTSVRSVFVGRYWSDCGRVPVIDMRVCVVLLGCDSFRFGGEKR